MTTELLIKIYLAGLVVLVVAVGLNMLANGIGLATWYSFLTHAAEQGLSSALKNLRVTDLLFLILLYPLLLGLSSYLTLNILTHVLH